MDPGLPPDPTHQFPRDLDHQVVHALRDALPSPVTDSPEDRIRRDNAIIATVASLRPANTAEVILASQFVAANAQALDCLRLARLNPTDAPHVLKCTAQSASMMRQSRGALGQLLRLQAAREKHKPDSSTHNMADAIEQAATRLIADALGCAPSASQPVPEAKSRNLAKAEEYALANPSSAALIRSLGRLPKKFDDGTTSSELVHEIVNGDSPILQALVKRPPHRLAAT